MSTSETWAVDSRARWSVGAGASLIYQPPGQSEPPQLVMFHGIRPVFLVPPQNQEDLADFRGFLRDLAEAVEDLRLMCHPVGQWGRQVLARSAG